MTALSVNVNKVAVLRNSRGGAEPSVMHAARVAMAAGCHGITVHPRPDQRHIRPADVLELARLVDGRVELNIEGNPFAPPRDGYPGLLALVRDARPTQVTLVPDSDGQLTSDHGFDLKRDGERLRPIIAALRASGARVSLFMDAGSDDLPIAAEMGAQRIELYTGPFAHAFARGDASVALAGCAKSCAEARSLGLGVNAGHDLSQANLAAFIAGTGKVDEVSIGHALFSEALYGGLEDTIRAYLDILAGVRGA